MWPGSKTAPTTAQHGPTAHIAPSPRNRPQRRKPMVLPARCLRLRGCASHRSERSHHGDKHTDELEIGLGAAVILLAPNAPNLKTCRRGRTPRVTQQPTPAQSTHFCRKLEDFSAADTSAGLIFAYLL